MKNELFIIPSDDNLLKNKKFDVREYIMLISESKFNNLENYRYVNKCELSFKEKAKELNISTKTLQRNISRLEKMEEKVLEIKKTDIGIVYKINNNNFNNTITIKQKMLKSLMIFNSNTIKTYFVLKNLCKENTFTNVYNEQLIESIGLSSKSKNNVSLMNEIIKILNDNNYIQYEYKHVNDGISTKKLKYYKINSYEEWFNYRKELLKIK